jgi:hypothetical protein
MPIRDCVLPLILNSKELVLWTYPLLAALSHKEHPETPDILADEIADFVGLQRDQRATPTL